ncbi:MAG TPA: amino acid permease [Bacteroidales bacterium]|nr:amino acid permease [Bacteroidales bacterium]HPO65100.1 amino acid permease [Bacteroidales bacterium]
MLHTFKKSLSLWDSTAIVAGSMIGSGIFIVSADIARQVGSPGWLLMVWVITGIMTVFAAVSYGELASMMPRAGGIYVYLREAYSPLVGFLYGWSLFLVIQTGTIAAVAMAFAKYAGVLFPWISESNILMQAGSLKITSTQLLAVVSILILTYINSRGIEEGKNVQNLFTYAKILILILFIGVGLRYAHSSNFSDFWTASQWKGGQQIEITGLALITAIGMAMVGSLFSSDAWYDITYTSAEVKKPRKTIAQSLILGTTIVSLLYLLINVVYISVLPVKGIPDGTSVVERGIQFASEDRVATAVMFQIFGKSAAIIMAIVVVISTIGCNNGIILSGARVSYAMAQDNLFFKHAAMLNKNKVPSVALYLQAAWSIVLCFTGTYSQLLDYVMFVVIVFYILTIYAVFIFRKKHPEADRPFRTPGYPFLPIVYIILCLFIEVVLLLYKPVSTWPGLIILLSGVPVYYIWRRSLRPVHP